MSDSISFIRKYFTIVIAFVSFHHMFIFIYSQHINCMTKMVFMMLSTSCNFELFLTVYAIPLAFLASLKKKTFELFILLFIPFFSLSIIIIIIIPIVIAITSTSFIGHDVTYRYCLTKISIWAKRSISHVFSLFIVPSPFFVHCPYKGRINRAESILTELKPY